MDNEKCKKQDLVVVRTDKEEEKKKGFSDGSCCMYCKNLSSANKFPLYEEN